MAGFFFSCGMKKVSRQKHSTHSLYLFTLGGGPAAGRRSVMRRVDWAGAAAAAARAGGRPRGSRVPRMFRVAASGQARPAAWRARGGVTRRVAGTPCVRNRLAPPRRLLSQQRAPGPRLLVLAWLASSPPAPASCAKCVRTRHAPGAPVGEPLAALYPPSRKPGLLCAHPLAPRGGQEQRKHARWQPGEGRVRTSISFCRVAV